MLCIAVKIENFLSLQKYNCPLWKMPLPKFLIFVCGLNVGQQCLIKSSCRSLNYLLFLHLQLCLFLKTAFEFLFSTPSFLSINPFLNFLLFVCITLDGLPVSFPSVLIVFLSACLSVFLSVFVFQFYLCFYL